MSKRALSVSILTAGLSAGLIAGAVSPAAAQGDPVGGTGNVYFLAGAGNNSGVADRVMVFGDPKDEVYFGDWDGDGVDTPLVRRGITFFVADQSGNTVDVFNYGNPGDRVLIGDWDGKNGDSLAVLRDGNHYFVKNNVKTSGKADSEFFYGDPTDRNVLVGDWDGDGKDTIGIQRGAEYVIKNDTASGKAEYSFIFGNPGDQVLVGDWALNGQSGDGHDQLAVRQKGNEYHYSEELSKDKRGLKTIGHTGYGDAGDTVFVASLPHEILDANGKSYPNYQRATTYAADTAAVHAAGDPVLVWDNTPGNGFAQLQTTDPITGVVTKQTYKGGEPVTQMPGMAQVYKGGEGVVTADGKPVLYVASGAATGDNAVDITTAYGWTSTGTNTGTIARYKAGEPVLDQYGNYIWVETSAGSGTWIAQTWTAGTATATTKALPAGDANKITVKVGDQVLRRSGEQAIIVAGAPAVRPSTGNAEDGRATGAAVVLNATGDYVFNPDGSVAKNLNGTYRTHGSDVVSATETYKAGQPVLRRNGEARLGFEYSAAGVAKTSVADGVTIVGSTVTSATANFTWKDVGRTVSGGTIPAGATITAINSATSVTISAAATGAATGVTLTFGATVTQWSGTSASLIPSDEAANWYLSRPATNTAPTAADKKVADLDADVDIEPVFYNGTEQYVTSAPANLPNYSGGEAVAAQRKGDVVRDKDGNVVMENTRFTGDGLGVRRNFG